MWHLLRYQQILEIKDDDVFFQTYLGKTNLLIFISKDRRYLLIYFRRFRKHYLYSVDGSTERCESNQGRYEALFFVLGKSYAESEENSKTTEKLKF